MYFDSERKACDFRYKVKCSAQSPFTDNLHPGNPRPQSEPEPEPESDHYESPSYRSNLEYASRERKPDYRAHGLLQPWSPQSGDGHDFRGPYESYLQSRESYRPKTYRPPGESHRDRHSHDKYDRSNDLNPFEPRDLPRPSVPTYLGNTRSPQHNPHHSQYRPRPYIPDADQKPHSAPGPKSRDEDNMVHFVHNEHIDMDIFKRIRRPGEPLDGLLKQSAVVSSEKYSRESSEDRSYNQRESGGYGKTGRCEVRPCCMESVSVVM